MDQTTRETLIESYGIEAMETLDRILRTSDYEDQLQILDEYGTAQRLAEMVALKKKHAEEMQDKLNDHWAEGFCAGHRKGWSSGVRGESSGPIVKIGPGGDFVTEVKP